MKKLFGGILTVASLTLLLGFGIKTSRPETATWNGDAWECPAGEPLIYFDGQHTADNATYEQAQRAKSNQVWCENEESWLTFFLETSWSSAKNRFGHAEQRREKWRQPIEQAQVAARVAENQRLANRCPTISAKVFEACLSLVAEQLIGTSKDFCKQLTDITKDVKGAGDFESCISDQKIEGAAEACALMLHDPDLAPACEDVIKPDKGSSDSNFLRH